MIRTSQASIYVTAITHPGLAGRQNEDRFVISPYRVSETDPTPSIFAIISDCIGGLMAGEVAAEMANGVAYYRRDLDRMELSSSRPLNLKHSHAWSLLPAGSKFVYLYRRQ